MNAYVVRNGQDTIIGVRGTEPGARLLADGVPGPWQGWVEVEPGGYAVRKWFRVCPGRTYPPQEAVRYMHLPHTQIIELHRTGPVGG